MYYDFSKYNNRQQTQEDYDFYCDMYYKPLLKKNGRKRY